jgi:hypothetical protein
VPLTAEEEKAKKKAKMLEWKKQRKAGSGNTTVTSL